MTSCHKRLFKSIFWSTTPGLMIEGAFKKTSLHDHLQLLQVNVLALTAVCTENLIRVDDVMESPKLAE